MNWFPLHIIVKDLSFLMFYFVIMKYNLTNETYLPETISNFPGAPEMTLASMISTSVFYNIIPLLISLVTYFPIVSLTRKILQTRNSISLITTSIFLTITTPTIYFVMGEWKSNDFHLKTAESIAWLLCFTISIITYYLLNKSDLKSVKLDKYQQLNLSDEKKNAL
jgi:hypothetical protein